MGYKVKRKSKGKEKMPKKLFEKFKKKVKKTPGYWNAQTLLQP